MKRIERLMRPQSVAVIGASDNPSRIGGRPIRYMLDAGYAGTLYPVNPNYQTVQGLTAHPTIKECAVAPDLAIIALPAIPAMQAVNDCARAGVGAVILFSADFAEAGPEGRLRQDELSRISQETGMVILGPNCLGAFNATHRLYGSFSAIFEGGFPEPGNVGIVSQSGGYGSHLCKIALKRGIRIGQWMTTGNEAGLDVGHCIEWMAYQADIDIILAYAEGVRSRHSLVAGLAAAQRVGKPVLFMKSGSSAVGAAAAQTHTAALSGADAVFDGMLSQYGAIRMPNTETAVDAAYLLQRCPRLTGNRLALVTISGAVGVQMADEAAACGLEIPPLPEEEQAALKALNPYAAVRNPIDITAQAFNRLELVRDNLEIALRHDGFDALVAFFTVTAGSRSIAPRLSEILSPLPAKHPDKPMVLCIVAEPPIVAQYEAAGFAVFEDHHRAVAALSVAARIQQAAATNVIAQPAQLPSCETLLAGHDGTEASAKRILSTLGIPVPLGRVANSGTEAGRMAEEIGFPVAIKVHSPSILHKSEVGGVTLNVRSASDVERLASDMLDRLPAAGVLVERMAEPGAELIVGCHHDSELGATVMIGLGGFFAELYKDVVFRLAPISAEEAKRAILELRGRAVLTGFRGQPIADIEAAANAIAVLSAFFSDYDSRIASLEINPLRVLPEGCGVVACDAVMLTEKPVA